MHSAGLNPERGPVRISLPAGTHPTAGPSGWRIGQVILAFALPFCVYLLPGKYHGGGDTVPAELLPISIVTEGNLDFNEFAVDGEDLPYWFRSINGRIVSEYPILPGLLNVPVFAVARVLGVDLYAHRVDLSLISAAGIAALSVLFMFLCLRSILGKPWPALGFAFLYAFGTCVWIVGGTAIGTHGPAVLFLSVAFLLLMTKDAGKVGWAGLPLALAVVCRPPTVLIAFVMMVYVFRHHRASVARFLLSAAVPLVLVSVYSQLYWKSVLAFGMAPRAGGFGSDIWKGLTGLLWSPSRGLFVFSPIFLFSVVGAFLAWRRKWEPRWKYLSVGALLVMLLYSRWGMWWGGVSFGYRLLIELVPILVLLLALAWREAVRKSLALQCAFFVLASFSVFVQVLGATVYPSDFNRNIDLETGRLWDWRESEIALLMQTFFGNRRAPDSGAEEASLRTIWWSSEKNDDRIPGWLDSSPGGSLVRGPLEVSGWAKSASGEVDVGIVLDNQVVIPERSPRPDVARALPYLGDTSRAGFRWVFQKEEGGISRHVLTVELRAPNGGVRRLGPIRFRWQGGGDTRQK